MFKKVLIPTDGSPLSTQAAKAGVAFARSIGAEVVVLHVQQPLLGHEGYEALSAAYAINKTDYDKVLAGQSTQYLQPILDQAKAAGVKAEGRSIHDMSIADRIVKTAEEAGCDLIFIGSHGRSGLSLLLLGSVAAKVLPLARGAVLVWHAREDGGKA
jgi:nucleotide-binding universal stress UspA family protein